MSDIEWGIPDPMESEPMQWMLLFVACNELQGIKITSREAIKRYKSFKGIKPGQRYAG